MRTSAAGIALIKRNEGCRLETYTDITGTLTIGYGETGPYVVPGLHYTQAQAEEGLARRLANEFEPGVMAAIGSAPTTQTQFDAMVSLAWNIGVSAFTKSTVAREHKAGDYNAAADAFRLWNQSKGKMIPALARRREEERALYLSDAQVKPADAAPLVRGEAVECEIDADLLADLIRALQRVVGSEPDGIMGPNTYQDVLAVQKEAQQ